MVRFLPALPVVCVLMLAACAGSGDSKPGNPDAEGAPPADYRTLVASGDDAMQRDDLDAAQVKYALAVSQQPENLDGLYKLAIVHYQKNSHDIASEILKRVIDADATHAGALETLGFIALKKEDFALAEARFFEVLDVQANRWRTWNGLGIVKDMQFEHEEAQYHFRQALQASPASALDRARVENNLGYSLYLQGHYARAQQHFLKATRLAPDYAKAWSNLGLGLARQGHYEDARAAFGKLVDTHVAANNLGYVGMLIGDFSMAKREISTALQTAPSYYALANENLALLNQRTGQAVRAVAAAQRSVETPPVALVPAVSRLKPAMPARTVQQNLSGSITRSAAQTHRTRSPEHATPLQRSGVATGTTVNQRKLASYLHFLGYNVAAAGAWSARQLASAVRDFQISHGLEPDGIAGRKTTAGISTATIKRVQLFLGLLGYSPGEENGELTRQTRGAIRAYEQDQSLPVDGRLDAALLMRLDGLP